MCYIDCARYRRTPYQDVPLHSCDAHAKITLIEFACSVFFLLGSVQFATQYPLSEVASGLHFLGKQMRLIVFNHFRFAKDFNHFYTHQKQSMLLFFCSMTGSELQPQIQIKRHFKFSVQWTARLPIHCLRCSGKWLFPNGREVNTGSVWLGLRCFDLNILPSCRVTKEFWSDNDCIVPKGC